MQNNFEYGYLANKPETDLAFLPVGSIEVHGGYIPLETDTIIAQACAMKFAQCTGGIMLPPLHAGVCPNTDLFPGTISVSIKSFFDYVLGILLSVHKKGFKKIVLVNIHNGNDAVLKTIVDEMYMQYNCIVYYVNPYTFFDGSDSYFSGMDNDYKETSLLLASCKILDLKLENRAAENETAPKNENISHLKKFGYIGYSYDCERQHIAPRPQADAKTGLKYIDAVCGQLPQIIQNLSRCLEDNEKR